MMGYYGGGMTGFAWVGMGLFWLVLLAFIAWLVIRLLPGTSQAPKTIASTSMAQVATPALAILDERLASGEVDLDTYRGIRAALLENREGDR